MRRSNNGTPPLMPAQVMGERRRVFACRRSWLRLFMRLVCAAAVASVLFGAVFGLALVRGDSMNPAYRSNDLALFFRLGGLNRGDVVILQMDGGRPSKYVKRIIGLPGDTVDIDGQGSVLVNGTPLDEPYIYAKTQPRPAVEFPLVLGAGEYFVLGDNRGHSQDSRSFGKVARRQVNGRVLAVFRVGS